MESSEAPMTGNRVNLVDLDSLEDSLAKEAIGLALGRIERRGRAEHLDVRLLGSDCIAIGGTKIIARSGADPVRPATLVVSIEHLPQSGAVRRSATRRGAANGR